jgi:hypothetical protein
MKHAIAYYGHFDRNFDDLQPNTTQYAGRDGLTHVVADPSPSVNGILFGYMEQQGKKFVAVKAADIGAEEPVPLDPDLHLDGKQFGPQPTTFGDTSAYHLIQSMKQLNLIRVTLCKLSRSRSSYEQPADVLISCAD